MVIPRTGVPKMASLASQSPGNGGICSGDAGVASQSSTLGEANTAGSHILPSALAADWLGLSPGTHAESLGDNIVYSPGDGEVDMSSLARSIGIKRVAAAPPLRIDEYFDLHNLSGWLLHVTAPAAGEPAFKHVQPNNDGQPTVPCDPERCVHTHTHTPSKDHLFVTHDHDRPACAGRIRLHFVFARHDMSTNRVIACGESGSLMTLDVLPDEPVGGVLLSLAYAANDATGLRIPGRAS